MICRGWQYLAGKVRGLDHDNGLEYLVRNKEGAILLGIDLLCPAPQQILLPCDLVALDAAASSGEGIKMRPGKSGSGLLGVLISA